MKRKQNQGKPGDKALKEVRKYFPKVNKVIDAKSKVIVTVTDKDAASVSFMDPFDCAFARACARTFDANGVMIGLMTSYIIKAKTAKRYKNTSAVHVEVVSFDRKGGFDTGMYGLSPFSPRQRLGVYKGRPTHPKIKGAKDRRSFRHYTRGVRVLGSAVGTRS